MMTEVVETNLEQFLIALSVSLGVAAISQFFSWFRRVPYTLLLVIVGLGLAFIDVRLATLSPQLILEILLPPLLFEAGWNMPWREFKENWIPIILYATLGVIISLLIVGFALNQVTALALPIALLVGAGISATDPVAVVALFKELGASPKLKAVTEGESLFNDGAAIVAFVLLLGIPLGTEVFSVPSITARSLTFIGVGLAVGIIIGFGISRLTQRIELPLVEQCMTLVSAYGSYIIAEHLGGSGVIAVAVTAMILGNFGSRIGMAPLARLVATDFWEFVAFLVNSIIFLLIGTQIRYPSLVENFDLIVISIIAAVIARFIVIFSLGAVSNFISPSKLSLAEQTVLWWGGLRGAVPIALALSVPESLAARQEIIDIVFGVVLFTLLVQGLTIPWVMKKLGLAGEQEFRQEYAQLSARRIALTRVISSMEQAKEQFPNLDPEYHRYQRELVKEELESVHERIQKLISEYPQLQSVDREQYRRTLADVEADTYAELLRSGWLHKNLDPVIAEIELKIIKEGETV